MTNVELGMEFGLHLTTRTHNEGGNAYLCRC